MDLKDFITAFILGVVEGLTEFLPVSSTGHQIIVADLLNFDGDQAEAFNIIIQLGAILAVVWFYRAKIIQILFGLTKNDKKSINFSINLFLAFLPSAILGLLFIDAVRKIFFNPLTVAVMLILGGIAILITQRFVQKETILDVDDVSKVTAFKIGLFQALAIIPGTSRSLATIVGGLIFSLSRKTATEFSFFLAIPTILAASLYSIYKFFDIFNEEYILILIVGFITSFIVALLTVKALLMFIANNSYTVFAFYRIIFGLFILITWYFNLINWSIFNI